MHFRLKKSSSSSSSEVVYHGNLCDRMVQTDAVPGLFLRDRLSTDKFKRFFFAVFYTYMMMNTVMVEALPHKGNDYKENKKK